MATNFKTTLEKLQTDFETRSDHTLKLVSGSTGKLYAQIINGAPYDVFLAADQVRPERLVDNGDADRTSRFTYAHGGLALWGPTRSEITPDTLWDTDVGRFALANPDLAPYGAASVQLLNRYERLEIIEPQLVYGESVGQAFAFISTGNAELGFVAASQVLALPEPDRGGYWLVPRQLHDPIAQDAVLLQRGADNPVAAAFLAYLKTDEARKIIRESGYWTEYGDWIE